MGTENKIIDICLGQRHDKLAAVLVFGSFRTGPFVKGISDIDTLIFYKQKRNINIEKEKIRIQQEGKHLNLSVQNIAILNELEKKISEEGSWSTWITILVGSNVIYSTPEFEKFKSNLSKLHLPKHNLITYLNHKDQFELDGYFKDLTSWNLTKGIFSHIRRKLQILNYYQDNPLEFDYSICLNNINDLKDKPKLNELGILYEKRRVMTKEQSKWYIQYSKELTKKVISYLQ